MSRNPITTQVPPTRPETLQQKAGLHIGSSTAEDLPAQVRPWPLEPGIRQRRGLMAGQGFGVVKFWGFGASGGFRVWVFGV